MTTEELMRQVQILRDEHERALDEMRQRIEQLNQRCEELAAKLVDCEGLRLADEQTIRNLVTNFADIRTILVDGVSPSTMSPPGDSRLATTA